MGGLLRHLFLAAVIVGLILAALTCSEKGREPGMPAMRATDMKD